MSQQTTASSTVGDSWESAVETRKQLVRFLVVGISSVAFDCALYFLLHEFFGVASSLAKGISYFAGVVCVGFVLNKFWTFESRERNFAEPGSYLTLYAITLFVNIACNALALSVLGPEQKLIAFLFATGVTTILNFVGLRFVTFRRGIEKRRENAEKNVDP